MMAHAAERGSAAGEDAPLMTSMSGDCSQKRPQREITAAAALAAVITTHDVLHEGGSDLRLEAGRLTPLWAWGSWSCSPSCSRLDSEPPTCGGPASLSSAHAMLEDPCAACHHTSETVSTQPCSSCQRELTGPSGEYGFDAPTDPRLLRGRSWNTPARRLRPEPRLAGISAVPVSSLDLRPTTTAPGA